MNSVFSMLCAGDTKPAEVPDFGAACDGDADRNMILGVRTPSAAPLQRLSSA